jgi:hypothetical protein
MMADGRRTPLVKGEGLRVKGYILVKGEPWLKVKG